MVAKDDETTKLVFRFCLLAVGMLLSGCAIGGSGQALEPVGAAPIQPLGAESATGTLVVYSAFEVNADFNRRDPYHREYSDYRIFSTNGNLLQRVHNDSGLNVGSPAQVKLPAGSYLVSARANGYGVVTVPVVTASNRLTTLHLEGSGSWPDKSAPGQTNTVRLPDGQVVGWRAAEKHLSGL